MAFRMDGILFLIIAMAFLEGTTAATQYKVGGDYGWAVPPPNNTSFYENWASNKTFEVGDSLEFVWNNTHNVLEGQTKADYDSCGKTNGVLKETSPEIYNLSENGTYYFSCTIGTHCVLGQKVTIVVGNGVSPPPKNHAALSAVLSTTTIVAATLIHLCSFLLYQH